MRLVGILALRVGSRRGAPGGSVPRPWWLGNSSRKARASPAPRRTSRPRRAPVSAPWLRSRLRLVEQLSTRARPTEAPGERRGCAAPTAKRASCRARGVGEARASCRAPHADHAV